MSTKCNEIVCERGDGKKYVVNYDYQSPDEIIIEWMGGDEGCPNCGHGKRDSVHQGSIEMPMWVWVDIVDKIVAGKYKRPKYPLR